MARERQKAGRKKRGTAPVRASKTASAAPHAASAAGRAAPGLQGREPDGAAPTFGAQRDAAPKAELREKAALHAQRRQDKAARTRVLRLQMQLCAVLLGVLLLCRTLCPPVFEAARQYYFEWFEEAGFSPQLVRFASAVLESIPVLSVQAAQAAPAGCSMQAYLPAQELAFPLEGTAWWFSSGYGWRIHPLAQELRFHRGDDLACAEGTPVLAALDGVITLAKRSTSYGNYLRIHHANGEETIYAHLQYLFVRAGEVVQAGQLLGTAGQTGEATGPHLHFEMLQNGTRYDPAAALHLPEESA